MNINKYDDWAICTCDYCGMDDLPLNEQGEPRYYCDCEDCKHLRYLYKE